jgi:succinoglycan biosynthesis protein ExoM
LRERGLTPPATAVEIAKAATKAAFCFAVAVPLFISPVRGRAALLRGALHAGVVSALFGSRDLQLYGQANGADVPSA